jgi:hypothetical protein
MLARDQAQGKLRQSLECYFCQLPGGLVGYRLHPSAPLRLVESLSGMVEQHVGNETFVQRIETIEVGCMVPDCHLI